LIDFKPNFAAKKWLYLLWLFETFTLVNSGLRTWRIKQTSMQLMWFIFNLKFQAQFVTNQTY